MNRPNELELPIERIEEALIQCALPGFWGELRIEVEVLPSARLEVALRTIRKTITQKDVSKEEGGVLPSTDRISKVRAKMPELREKFRLYCPVAELKALFKDGNLVVFEISECGDLLWPQKAIPVK